MTETYVIICGDLFWGDDGNWTKDRGSARIFDEIGPDWSLPFAPDEYNDSDPWHKPRYLRVS